jgi:hypothetical protein
VHVRSDIWISPIPLATLSTAFSDAFFDEAVAATFPPLFAAAAAFFWAAFFLLASETIFNRLHGNK